MPGTNHATLTSVRMAAQYFPLQERCLTSCSRCKKQNSPDLTPRRLRETHVLVICLLLTITFFFVFHRSFQDTRVFPRSLTLPGKAPPTSHPWGSRPRCLQRIMRLHVRSPTQEEWNNWLLTLKSCGQKEWQAAASRTRKATKKAIRQWIDLEKRHAHGKKVDSLVQCNRSRAELCFIEAGNVEEGSTGNEDSQGWSQDSDSHEGYGRRNLQHVRQFRHQAALHSSSRAFDFRSESRISLHEIPTRPLLSTNERTDFDHSYNP